MKFNFSAFEYKDMWEGFCKKYGNYWGAFDVREPNSDITYIEDLMNDYQEEYGKEWIKRHRCLDVEKYYKE